MLITHLVLYDVTSPSCCVALNDSVARTLIQQKLQLFLIVLYYGSKLS